MYMYTLFVMGTVSMSESGVFCFTRQKQNPHSTEKQFAVTIT